MGAEDRTGDIVSAARAGEPAALTELYRGLFPGVVRYLHALEPGDAEDLASETWLNLVAALSRFDGDLGDLRALAFTIARRRAIDLRRRRARSIPVDPSDAVLAGAAWRGDAEEESMFRLETREALEKIATLPRDQAEVVLLRVLGGLSVRQVASVVGKRPGAVRALQHRGLRRLARTFSWEAVTR